MGERLPDIDGLEVADLKKLLLEAIARIAALTVENAALREEVVRLKGLKGRLRMRQSVDGTSNSTSS